MDTLLRYGLHSQQSKNRIWKCWDDLYGLADLVHPKNIKNLINSYLKYRVLVVFVIFWSIEAKKTELLVID